jgi:hypothetical protein
MNSCSVMHKELISAEEFCGRCGASESMFEKAIHYGPRTV